ncbi:MAG: hypothetical protein IT235_06605 [Bacteroidia bacterium]|nr:hypothetical protein [Bacteroidia bacterium]
MQRSIVVILFNLVFFTSQAQQIRTVAPYNAGIGLRGGFLYGISYKQFLAARPAVEIIAGTRWRGYSLTALFEYQKAFRSAKNLDWFAGFGVHGGTYEERYFLESSGGSSKSTKSIYAIGVDAIVGIEFSVIKIPLSFGIDFKPFMDLVNSNQNYLDAALTIRYVFR